MDIPTALSTFGAAPVYQAGVRRLEGDPGPMERIGYNNPTLAQANELMSAAFSLMTESEKELDLYNATDALFDTLQQRR